MKSFVTVAWDAQRCGREIGHLRALLAKHDALGEKEHVLPLFRRCSHLAAFVGSYHPRILTCNRLAFEYDLFGDFTCDLVSGDSTRNTYNFVEFEDARPSSVFRRQGRKATREASPRFEHGWSQIIDWFCKLRDMEKSDEFVARFGARTIDFTGTLVVGRERHLRAGERRRLEWRRGSVIVDSKQIQCVTYDELLTDLTERLQRYTSASPRPRAGKR